MHKASRSAASKVVGVALSQEAGGSPAFTVRPSPSFAGYLNAAQTAILPAASGWLTA